MLFDYILVHIDWHFVVVYINTPSLNIFPPLLSIYAITSSQCPNADIYTTFQRFGW